MAKTSAFKTIVLSLLVIIIGLQVLIFVAASDIHRDTMDITNQLTPKPTPSIAKQQIINDYIQSLPSHVCNTHEYQLEVEEDGLLIYDGDRFVGFAKFQNNSVDKVILRDNQ
jgi:hypothetical protein